MAFPPWAAQVDDFAAFDHYRSGATVSIDRCTRCRLVIGPCESSVFLRNCDDIRGVVACQQLRTRDVNRLELLLLTASQPSVETTTDARFGCFALHYAGLEGQLAAAGLSVFSNRWAGMA